MLRKSYNLIMLSLFSFFKMSFFLSLFFLSVFLFLKSKEISHKKSVKSLGALSTPISKIQEKEFFYTETQGTNAGFKISREEIDISRIILKFSDEIAPSDALKLAKLIREECENYGIDPFLILAVIQVESEFSPKAVSPKGAIGLMQVTPETAEFIAGELGVFINGKNKSLYNPFINVRLGIYYLFLLNNRFKSVEQALIAYNAGPNRLSNTGKRLPAYVRKVLSFKSRLEAEQS